MNKNNLYFDIEYCSHKYAYEEWKYSGKFTKKIKHNELFLVTGGKGRIAIEKKEYIAVRGMLFYFRPEVLHSFESDVNDPLCFLKVHFSYVHVNFIDNKWSLTLEDKPLKIPVMQKLENYYAVLGIFKRLVKTWDLKLPSYEFISRTILQKLVTRIYDNLKMQSVTYSSNLKVEKIIEYLHQNINKTVKVEELSEMTGLSSSYISRIFKDATGYSIIKFFNKMKIDKAEALMLRGNKKVKEVSRILGFEDEFYFSRLFKKIKGVSPKEFYNRNVHGY